jgi:eukaryotic-like serine/threonine-protein kinase
MHAPVPTAHRAVPGVDAGLAAIIEKCLEPSPSKRFANPQAVLAALDTWSLQRVRRPLLLITGVVFALLFVAMVLFGQYLFRTTVNTAAHGVETRALQANRFAAETEARQFASQIQLRWLQLEAASRNDDIKKLLRKGDRFPGDPALGLRLDQLLTEYREEGNRQFAEQDKSPLWFAHDAEGYQRGSARDRAPGSARAAEAGRNIYRGYRDYFHGQGERPKSEPPPPGIIRKPHRSVAYRRERPGSTHIWSVAFSVPVMNDAVPPQPVGIVGMTITLTDAPTEDADRFAVLVDTRPDKNGRSGLILRHPYWAGMDNKDDPPLYYADEVVKWANQVEATGNENLLFEAGEYYIDPVSVPHGNTPGVEEYSGAWLAGVHRVQVGPEKIDTGWVVLVQERRDVTLQPVRDLQWRLGYVGLAAAVIALGLVGAMWLGVMAVMDSSPRSPVARLLRRWAGLPTSATSLTSGTSAPLSSLPAAITPRGAESRTLGQGER